MATEIGSRVDDGLSGTFNGLSCAYKPQLLLEWIMHGNESHTSVKRGIGR